MYNDFKAKNKSFWMWFNVSMMLLSLGFIVGTYFLLAELTADCGNLRFTMYVGVT